jgi:general stress protein 26
MHNVHQHKKKHPIWFTLDGQTIVFTTGEHSVKAATLRRDARVCLCVDDETPPMPT